MFSGKKEINPVSADISSGVSLEVPKHPTMQLKLVENHESIPKGNTNEANTVHETDMAHPQQELDSKGGEVEPTDDKKNEQCEESIEDAERRKKTLDSIRQKRQEMFAKTQLINSLHIQIANLNAPVAQDVSKLRSQLDRCFAQVRELRDESVRVNESIEKAVQVQQKLQDQLGSLEEKRKEAIFELENKHLVQLKVIEEEIRQLL